MSPTLVLSVPLFFLNDTEAQTIDAIASRIYPADELSGGAHEAEVVVYIDRTLSGYSRHLQFFYRDGLGELDRYCLAHYGGSFVRLTEVQQEEVLGQLDSHDEAFGEQGVLPPVHPPSAESEVPANLKVFFDVMWEHTMQGMFGDPAYGGNKDAIGWRALGFPGAQWGYSPEQRARGFDAKSIPIRTLTDLQRERPWETAGGEVAKNGEHDSAPTT